MAASALRLLVFDLDGTLIDSSLDLCNSINATLEHVGKPALPNATIASYIGDGAAMLVRRALGDPGDADSLEPSNDALFRTAFSFFLTYYRTHKLDNTYVYPGVHDALALMREQHPDVLMAVLTNKPVGPSRAICDALGLSPFFFQNYGGDSFATKKPDPEGLQMIFAEARAIFPGLTLDEVVMIGDSDVDVLTARRAGVRSLGCSYGLAPHAMAAAEPDHIVAHASEWPEALGLL
ncbi:HAD family hydrolase [Granulicella cerasi]|uniref:phosphoglycolate phosphatase n=1 Tax=Granulicella cerasi TaxID=741063 RepID=A0ABW1Z718_9BACT|nr:HAD hydrolase-like protein [Granulicella cerasi]